MAQAVVGRIEGRQIRHHTRNGQVIVTVTAMSHVPLPASGGCLDESPEDAARIVTSGAEVKEMEAAAVAWIGSLHDVPVGAVKAITDLVDSPVTTAEQFSANLATAADSLQRTTLALLARLGEEIGADA